MPLHTGGRTTHLCDMEIERVYGSGNDSQRHLTGNNGDGRSINFFFCIRLPCPITQ